jgi:GT2 family glycosyltransferase
MTDRLDLDGVTGRVLPLDAVGARTVPVSTRVSIVRREFSGRALPWEVGSGNNFTIRREALARVGGCDERLGPGAPAQGGVDMDLFHRLLRDGSRILYEPDAIVYHERQTREERRARRPMYGRGMGAAIALWHRAGDPSSGYVLREWAKLRLRQMRLAATRRDWADVRDEVTMLLSTVRGLSQGWTLGNGSH